MKKMFGVVVVLLIIYITFQIIYSYTVGRRTISYKIVKNDKEYQINEIFTTKHKSDGFSLFDKSSYYYEIKSNDKLIFSFKIVDDYVGLERFLTDIQLYEEGNLACMYPVFKEKINDIDVICNDNQKQVLYSVLKGQKSGLDTFVTQLKTLGYKHPSWEPTNLETKNLGVFSIYPKNITDDLNIAIWQYKGFYRITSRSERLYSITSNDQYSPNLTTMVNQYYVVPDYKDKYKFRRLFITNLISGSMSTIDIGTEIPYDSFIQGVVDGKIYLIDRSNKIQYAIDIYEKIARVSGDLTNSTKYYNNGKWEQKSIYEIIDDNLVFNYEIDLPENLKAYNPLFADEIGGETDGYYYLYLKENNDIGLYRVDKQNLNVLTLLFKVSSINRIKYAADDIYFVSNDTLYSYRDSLGLRPLVKYTELVFNKNDLYNVYVNE